MRHLWLHGFASGPTSSKGRFVGERLRERGIELVIPDLNEPAFFDLTVTRMLERVDALAGADRVALFGSSLGGFTAATWAARRPGRGGRAARGPRAARRPPRALAADRRLSAGYGARPTA